MRAVPLALVAAGALAAGLVLTEPSVAWARGEQTGSCDLRLVAAGQRPSHSLDCDWTASGSQTWLTIDNDSDTDAHCVAEATFEILWDDAQAQVLQGNTATLVLKRDPGESDWYEFTCTSTDGGAKGSSSFHVWAD
ncbi:hypothetical protein [[Mycobacterium] wendilense]|uniref:Ig-like domain-containing protein n=1 Tax=[Mycobacterium] wendilense TaxID=3064284 RepID=A0ABN9P4Y0_9MYCO|nr:hypothetical protein [Mycolicibacterium sp. MU0050]CAJ1584576.1 hypothetical protein MU0050_003261 [Mycolicibacterium sp. MU0050]